MMPGDFLWLFFMFSALQPVLKQRFLEASRQRLIAKIEHARGSRVILLVHRQETMSLLGFPLMRYIDVNDSEAVLRAIHLTDPAVPLDIVLMEPVDRNAGLKRELKISGTIGDKDRARLFPSLNDLLSGPLALSVTMEGENRQRVETDLARSVVSLPWIGWSKGAGVPAKATFVLDKQDGVTRLSNFNFSGDGFAVLPSPARSSSREGGGAREDRHHRPRYRSGV